MRSIDVAFVMVVDALKSLREFTRSLRLGMKSLHVSCTNVLIGLHLVYMTQLKGCVKE